MTQLSSQLLISTPVLIGIIAVGVVLLALFLYGFFVRFSRIGWTGGQVLAVFGGTLLLSLIPGEGIGGFAIVVGGAIGITVVVMLLGGILRGYFRRRPRRANLFFRIVDHLLGAAMAMLNFLVPLLALGGAGLVFVYHIAGADSLGGLFENAIWTDFCAPHALDLLIVSLFVSTVGNGYRLGLLRSIWALFAVVLVFGVAILSVVLMFKAPFLSNFANMLAEAFSSLDLFLSYILGYAITYFLCCFVLLAVVMLLHFLIHLLVKQIDKVRPLRFIDGAIMTVVFCALTIAILCGINFGVYMVADAELPEMISGAIPADLLSSLQDVFCSSPIARAFYEDNPIRVLGA